MFTTKVAMVFGSAMITTVESNTTINEPHITMIVANRRNAGLEGDLVIDPVLISILSEDLARTLVK